MNIIKKIKEYIENNFGYLSVNKKNELIRLLYEISKKENVDFFSIIENLEEKRFSYVKSILLKKRFPVASYSSNESEFYLPPLDINPEYKAQIPDLKIYPKKVFYEESVRDSALVAKFKMLFPKAIFEEIISLKNFNKDKIFTLKDYNERRNTFFIVKENFDFFKPCPCTPNAVNCGYHICNFGFGCIYECVYCFLQGYQNVEGIIIPANIEDFFAQLKLNPRAVRFGSGEFTDSLIFDDITEFSSQIIDFFKNYPQMSFEFKTKSKNIENILKTGSQKNIIISWSLNPEKIIKENEFYSTTLDERLEAAYRCASAGFKVGFHFDPIIYYNTWQEDYCNVVNQIFDKIPNESIFRISLGTLRMVPYLKRVIENRFPENKILDGELIIGYDKKLRYPESLRVDIYKNMIKWIKKRSANTYVYLCMEENKVLNEIKL